MTHQPTFFGFTHTTTRQPELFPTGGRVSPLTCSCGRPLEHTPGGYLACPRGHGRLIEAESSGRWFEDEPDALPDLYDTSPE